MADATPVLIITGPVGVGKTTVANAIAERLERAGVPHALVDMDALRGCFPRPADDPFHVRLGIRNLTMVWRNCFAFGARRLILADVVETPDLSPYHAAVPGAEIAVVRLVADRETIAERLRRREQGSGLEWHLARAVELADLLEQNRVGDLVVHADGRTPDDLAIEVLQRAAWPG